MTEEERRGRGKASYTSISSRFGDEIVRKIDIMATASGSTRSEILHEAMMSYLGRVEELKILEDLLSLARLKDSLQSIDAKIDQVLEKLPE